MPKRCLVFSYDPEYRTETAARWLRGKDRGAVLLAASRPAADDFARRYCLSSGDKLGILRFSPAQLATTLATAELAKRGRVPISNLGSQALAARVAHFATARHRLHYFESLAALPGFARALASTLLEARLAKIESDQLHSIGAPSAVDLAELLSAYDRELVSLDMADRALILRTAASVARRGEDPLLRLPLLLLEVSASDECETEFLEALVRQSPDVLATSVPFETETIKTLEAVLGVSGQDLDSERRPKNRLQSVRCQLFEPGGQRGVDDGGFEPFSAAGEGRECVEIARRILKLSDGGICFDQIAVFLRSPELYQPQLEEALKRAGIPAFFSKGTLRPDPAGRAFLSLLNCAQESLSASRFAEYLSLGQVPRQLETVGEGSGDDDLWVAPSDELQMGFKSGSLIESDARGDGPASERSDGAVVAGTLRTPIEWEKLLVDAAVIGGKHRWKRRLTGLESELKLKLRAIQESGDQGEYLSHQLQLLRNLREFALPLVERLADLPDKSLWGDWLKKLQSLAASSLRRPETVLAVLAELEPMERVGPVDLFEVKEVLKQRLSFLRIEPPGHRYGRVFVGTTEEAASRRFEVVFLPGLAEGIFPRKVLEDPLFLDEHRNRMEARLLTRKSRLEEERNLLRKVVAATGLKLFVSYPRMDLLQGKARVPSLYLLELLRAAEGRLPDLGRLEMQAAGIETRLGWPAPTEPDDAIDRAEYDLSTVGRLLQDPAGNARGRGRFLLEVSSALARSIRTRFKRWGVRWSDVDGLVATRHQRSLDILKDYGLTNKPYSATTLQLFAVCPYRFFLYGIQKLRPYREAVAVERMDPLIRGSIFHQVQFEMLQTLSSGGTAAGARSDVDQVIDLIDQILDSVAERHQEELAPAIPRVWKSEVEDLRVDLRIWIRDCFAALSQEQAWKPKHWEFAFGLPGRQGCDPASQAEPVRLDGGFLLKGAIDLVEERMNGRLRVTDHKTGKAPWPKPVFAGRGEVLQPLLYALAAERIFSSDHSTASPAPAVESGQIYYCTQRGGFKIYELPLTTLSREKIRQVLETIEGAISNGFLPAVPRERACDYCDYRLICGPYEEIRATFKDPAGLVRLSSLRVIP